MEVSTNLVVATAKGIDFKMGAILDGARPLKLETGQQLTLIAINGMILRVTGPFEGPPLPTPVRNTDLAYQSDDWEPPKTPQIHYGHGGGRALPEPWLIRVDGRHGSVRCVRVEDHDLALWSATKPSNANLTLHSADNAINLTATWPTGMDRLTIPREKVPVHDGQPVTITFDGAATTLVLRLIPADLSTEPNRAAWMVEAGCDEQARALVRSFSG